MNQLIVKLSFWIQLPKLSFCLLFSEDSSVLILLLELLIIFFRLNPSYDPFVQWGMAANDVIPPAFNQVTI